MKQLLLILTILLISHALCADVKIYVSPDGDDHNPGTKEQPLATLDGARDKIRALRSDTPITDTIFVELQSGTYYITEAFRLEAADSGTPQSPVVFRGNKDDRPLLCGRKPTGAFEAVTPQLWRAYLHEVADYGHYFEQLYINGQRRFRAQTPNRGAFAKVKRNDPTSGCHNPHGQCTRRLPL